MLTVICSTEQIESMEYYLRSSGVADVFLRKNIQKQETEDGGAGKGTPYTADEVYFAVTGEKASKESIAEDFDYWYNKGEEIDSPPQIIFSFAIRPRIRSKCFSLIIFP